MGEAQSRFPWSSVWALWVLIFVGLGCQSGVCLAVAAAKVPRLKPGSQAQPDRMTDLHSAAWS